MGSSVMVTLSTMKAVTMGSSWVVYVELSCGEFPRLRASLRMVLVISAIKCGSSGDSMKE